MKRLGTLIDHLRRLVVPAGAAGQPDAALLQRFLESRDDLAFEVLLWRHGPMVLGVCRRVLSRTQDVEDAFQATFLALVQKGGSISRRESVASWLYKVAYRAALRARAAAAKRTLREQPVYDTRAAEPADEVLRDDLRRALDEEVNRLPARYRVPFVLCCLQGKTHQEAARELGCPPGTVSYRLAWARQRLRVRLTRRGLALPAGGFAALLSQTTASALVPVPLTTSTLWIALRCATHGAAAGGAVPAPVAALTQGVLRTMFIAKVKMVTAIGLTVAVLGTGGGLVTYRPQDAAVARVDDAPTARPETPPPPNNDPRKRGQEQAVRSLDLEKQALLKQFQEVQVRQKETERELVQVLARYEQTKAMLDRVVAELRRVKQLRDDASSSAELEKARDEIEQLEAQLEVKKAHIQVARANLQTAQARLQGLQGVAQAGAVGKPELDQVRFGVVAAEAQLHVKEAELKEPAVRLKQARRRLANLEQAGKPPQDSGPGTRERRLLELEKQLDMLRKEIDALRREKGASEARPSKQ
jgi:RNA polymerase sigma factor (sigma-70 family)